MEFRVHNQKIQNFEKIDEIVKERNRTSGDGSGTAPTNPTTVSPERPRHQNQHGNTSENQGDLGEEREPVQTKKDLEQLKGILQKELITKDDKNLLPITKYTEQRHDHLKMLVG